ncbi:MAG: helix-turn-helix domain-containing protein [Mangrovibacterium sp.]
MGNQMIHEISPLSETDCFYIVERYKTEFTYPLHQHREYELNFIEGGAGITRIVGDSVETIGDYELVLLGSPNLEHVWEQGNCKPKSMREITIQFSPDLLSQNLMLKNQFNPINKMLERARNGLVFPLSAIMKVYSLLDNLSAEKPGFYQVLQILTILYELSLCEGARPLSNSSFVQIREGTDSRRVAKVEEYINHHYTEEIRLTTVASIAGMTPTAFSRFFKLRTGRCLSDYVIDMRLGVASRLLVDSTKSIAEICYECGFNNLSNFNRIFKKKKTITPKKFREYYYKKKIIC